VRFVIKGIIPLRKSATYETARKILFGVFMKGVVLIDGQEGKKKPVLFEITKNFFLYPCFAGFFGFSLFFTVILISKVIGLFAGSVKFFEVDIADITLAMLGFVLMFAIKLLESVRKKLRD
jgi:hypothetical protein